jgi:hypothetical protein
MREPRVVRAAAIQGPIASSFGADVEIACGVVSDAFSVLASLAAMRLG